MKTNLLKTGIAIIIAIACSYSLICMDKSSDNSELSDDYQTTKNSLDKSSDDYQAAKVTTDSGWVQKDGYLEHSLQVGSISFFRYSNDGQYLFTFGNDYTFRKWDVKTGKVVKEKKFEYINAFDMNTESELIGIIRFDTNGNNLHIYQNDSIICSTNIYKYFELPPYCSYDGIILKFYNNSKKLNIYFNGSCNSAGIRGSTSGLCCWDYDSNIVTNLNSFSIASSIIISKNDEFMLFSTYSFYESEDESAFHTYLFLRHKENNDGIRIGNILDSISYTNLAFSNNLKYLTASRSKFQTFIWDIEQSQKKYTLDVPNLKYSQFSADDRFLITTLEKPDTSIIKFFLAETGVEADSIYFASKSHNGIITVAPDSVNIAIAGNDGRIRIFQPKIFNRQFFASFSADSTVKQSSNPVHFKDYSFYNPTSWHWDFGDGTTSIEQDPIHFYTSKGIYTVKLIVSNGKIIDTLIRKDFINIHNPVIADFDVSINNDTIPFTAQFINKSKGDLSTYNWNFSYNKISSDENPEILFDKWGEYDVSLIVSDSYFFDTLLVKKKIIAYPPAIPLFKTRFESHYPVENEKIYGLDCIETFEGDFITLANMNDKYKILMRTNKNGEIIWKKNIAKGKKLAETLDSCIVVVSDSITTIKGVYVSKYNIDGNFIWDKLYNIDTMTNHTPFDVKSTIDGGFIIAAEAVSPTIVTMSSCFKIDKNGNLTMYNASYSGKNPKIITTKDSNYYLITDIFSINNIRLIKIDNNCNIIWQKNYNTKSLYSSKAIQLGNGDLLIAGWSGNINEYRNPYIIKVDSIGNKIWEYSGVDNATFYNTISSISDTLFAASGNFYNQLGVDIINNQGELVNSVRFPERNGVINSIVTTKDNDLFLTGSITPPYKFSQLYTLLLKHPYIITSVKDEQTENIANPELPFSIFPNPTNSTTTLQYKIETPSNIKIELINFIGTKVSEVENAFKEVGKYSSLINFENLAIAKGIYFVRFIANGKVFICKLVYV